METKTNALGYDLFEITSDEWILNIRGGDLFAGSFQDTLRYSIKMGFELDELEHAVNEMMKLGHNGAHFGVFKGFIHTFNKDFTARKAG